MLSDGKLDEVAADDRLLDFRAEVESGDGRLLGVDAGVLEDDAAPEVVVTVEHLSIKKVSIMGVCVAQR